MESLKYLVLLSIFAFTQGEIYYQKGYPHVKLSDARQLQGSVDFSRDGRPFNSFLGINFAKVPGRFEPAELIPGGDWEQDKIFKAVAPGPGCAQYRNGKFFGEDLNCLSLNVYAPINSTVPESLLPVMVYIHGGAFVAGGGFMYGPRYFMDEPVIMVTFNYRLGVMGFLSTGDDVIPGNNGLKDQVLALQWVQKNIKNFGGDPSRVTIFGESAGSASVHYLMLSDKTDGLFSAAISQSGTALGPWAIHVNPRKYADKLAVFVKCPTEDSLEMVKCLKTKTPEELLIAQNTMEKVYPKSVLPMPFGPVKEPESSSAFMSKTAWEVYLDENHKWKEVPWLVGVNEDEGAFYAGLFHKEPETLEELDTNFEHVIQEATMLNQYMPQDEKVKKDVLGKLRKFYFGDAKIGADNKKELMNLYSDILFNFPTYAAAVETARVANKAPVYLYQFAYKGPEAIINILYGRDIVGLGRVKNVGHADDTLLLFNMGAIRPDLEQILEKDPADELFSKEFVKLWASFAIHGKPKHSWGDEDEQLIWQPVSDREVEARAPLRWYKIDSKLTLESDFYKDRIRFCMKMWRKYFLPSVVPPKVLQELKDKRRNKQKTEL